MRHSWIAVVAGLPLLMAASLPVNRPVLPPAHGDLVNVGFFDRLLQDNSQKRRPSSNKTRSRKSQQTRTATPALPAVIPVPTAKPTGAEAATPVSEPPKPDTAALAQPAVPAEQPAPAPVEKPAPAPAEKPTPAAEPAPPAPTVEQPATAAEPAHEAEVPKPQPKPTEDAPQPAKPDAASPGSGNGQPPAANPSAEPATPAQPGVTEPPKEETKPAEPPPPPIASEDPEELKACLADLETLGTKFKPIDRIDDGEGCGIDKPIEVAQVLPGIATGGAVMRCETARALGHWLRDTVQPAMSVAMPNRKITGIVPGSTYACRLRNNAATGKISEHARGNGFDVAAFKFDNGEKMEMTPRGDDHTMEGAFQRTVTAGACLHFTTVLAPGSDASHETHMHLDVIDRKGGYRICE